VLWSPADADVTERPGGLRLITDAPRPSPGPGEVMGQLFGLLAAGVLGPGQPTVYELAEGPKALAELEARATVGKLALLP